MIECEWIVVGAGGMGSAAFWFTAQSGREVVAIDPFPAGHDRGSSHGQSRMIRGAYFEHPNYVPLVLESFDRWHELEQRSGRRLLHPTGVLEVGFPGGPIIEGILASAGQHNLAVETLSRTDVINRFPQFEVGSDQVAVFEKRAGLLVVEDCVQAMIEQAISAGGQFDTGSRVLSIKPSNDGYHVQTDRADYHGQKIVVTVGPWSGELLDFLTPYLIVRRKHQYWFAMPDPAMQMAQGGPAYFFETAAGYFYGFPVMEAGLGKLARHSGGEPVGDPTNVLRSIDEDDLRLVRGFARQHLRLDLGQPNRYSVCMYTVTPDEHFVVDLHPSLPGVAFVAGLSGHGFKFAPVLGEYVIRLADGQRDSRFDFLRCSRFR